ncbi:hypothetical protein B9Z55_025448 [Caenorhabditis nigoni]|nr:hypothetical protein B9Z55_025448 [Caenorhabditis nigoni]
MKKLIKSSSQMQRFKNVNTIRYDHRDEGTFVYIPFYNLPENMLRIAKHDNTKHDYFKLNVSGKWFDFRIIYDFGHYYPVAYYHRDETECLLNSIHGYFLDFFGNSVKYYWHARDYKQPIPKLQNLSVCLYHHPGMPGTNSYVLNMRRFENFFSVSPIFKFIEIYKSNITEPLRPESKFYQAEYIESVQYDTTLPAILHHFQGRQAYLKIVGCENRDVIEFVGKWKSGEAFDKFEHIKIETGIGGFTQNEILNTIGAKHLDRVKKPPTHVLPKVYDWHNRNPNTDPITSHTYIVRESDNRVASILIEGYTFNFGVWDKTEEEFLRMIG